MIRYIEQHKNSSNFFHFLEITPTTWFVIATTALTFHFYAGKRFGIVIKGFHNVLHIVRSASGSVNTIEQTNFKF